MKISKGSPIVQFTRRALGQKGLMNAVPKMFRLGGWIFMLFY